MLGRLCCLFNRHKPRKSTSFRGDKGARYAICARCKQTIRQNSQNRWVRKRHPLSEHELDAQYEAMNQARRSRRRR